MRGWKFLACAAVAVAVPVLPAGAVNQTVSVTDDQFTPANVIVSQGETVTWNNSGENHNVVFDDGSFTSGPISSDNWTATRPFNTPATFGYYCEAHGGPGGQDMSGTVTVQASSGGGGGGGTGGGGGGSGGGGGTTLGSDKTAPGLGVTASASQRVLRQKNVRVTVSVDEAATVVAQATVSVPGASAVVRTKKKSAQVAAGSQKTLRLGFSRKNLSKVRKALRKRNRLTAKVTVSATDKAGNKRTAKSTSFLRK